LGMKADSHIICFMLFIVISNEASASRNARMD
jgi:hypothetical protein